MSVRGGGEEVKMQATIKIKIISNAEIPRWARANEEDKTIVTRTIKYRRRIVRLNKQAKCYSCLTYSGRGPKVA